MLLRIALPTLFFVFYASHSILRHRAFLTTGFDLGIFEQIVRSYAEGHWPTADLLAPGAAALGDHFHPILALLAPFYRLWPAPETLLVAQAALLALSVIPVMRLATRLLGVWHGTTIAICYGISWGLLNAVRFDFHEICFAVPLIACVVERLALRKWRAAARWALPLVLVKEDLPLTIAAVGVYLLLHRQRRLGITLIGVGLAICAALITIVLPALNGAGKYAHSSNLENASLLAGLDSKAATVVMLLAPTAFVALRSPLLLLMLPTLGWRFISGNPSYWGTSFHYSAVLMPIVFAAFADGLSRLRRSGLPFTSTRVMNTAVALAAAVSAVLAIARLFQPGPQPDWTASQAQTARVILDRIPDGATVAASNRLAPHLTARAQVQLFPRRPGRPGRPTEWIVVARPSTGWPISLEDEESQLGTAKANGYRLVSGQGHIVLLRRTSIETR